MNPINGRFLARGSVKPNAALAPASGKPELQYQNIVHIGNPLAERVEDRATTIGLVVNMYSIISDYLTSDCLHGFDLSAMSDEDRIQVRDAVWYRSLYGIGLLARIGGRILALSPRYWWPLMEGGHRIGSVVVVPFNSKNALGIAQGASLMPDMALVTEHVDGELSKLLSVSYSGISLGADFRVVQGGVEAIAVFGDGRPDFPKCEKVIEAIDALLRAGNNIVDRHSQPHLQVPASIIQIDDRGNATLPLSKAGNIFPVQADDKDVKFVTVATDSAMIQFLLETQISLLASTSGLPSSAFNLFPLARVESGISIQELAKPSTNKTSMWQEDLERAMLELGLEFERLGKGQTNGLEDDTDGNDDDADADGPTHEGGSGVGAGSEEG